MQQGTVRLLLAIFVAYSHFPGSSLPINLGVSAVIGFYFLAGYLMSASYTRLVSRPAPIRKFYVDRFLRIFPCFFIIFIMTLLYSSISTAIDFRESSVFFEFFIIPQNYFFIFNFTSDVVPPAWSLGAELQWYLLLPFYFLIPNNIKIILLLIFILGQSFVFLPNLFGIFEFYYNDSCRIIATPKCFAASDLFGYRLLIFVSIPFMIGHLFHDQKSYKINSTVISLCYLYFIIIFVILSSLRQDYWVPTIDVLVGYVFIIPLSIGSLSIENKYILLNKNTDRWVGKFAYPIFLSHFLSMWVANDITNNIVVLSKCYIIIVWINTLLISIMLVLMQELVDKFRYRIRETDNVISSH